MANPQRYMQREVMRAHRQEVRAERKADRLHVKAACQAARGNLGRAVNLESRAQNQERKANNAHNREVRGQIALARCPPTAPAVVCHPRTYRHTAGRVESPAQVIVVAPAPQVPTYTVTTTAAVPPQVTPTAPQLPTQTAYPSQPGYITQPAYPPPYPTQTHQSPHAY